MGLEVATIVAPGMEEIKREPWFSCACPWLRGLVLECGKYKEKARKPLAKHDVPAARIGLTRLDSVKAAAPLSRQTRLSGLLLWQAFSLSKSQRQPDGVP